MRVLPSRADSSAASAAMRTKMPVTSGQAVVPRIWRRGISASWRQSRRGLCGRRESARRRRGGWAEASFPYRTVFAFSAEWQPPWAGSDCPSSPATVSAYTSRPVYAVELLSRRPFAMRSPICGVQLAVSLGLLCGGVVFAQYPGQYPPGQYPPGQYPPGQYPPGQYLRPKNYPSTYPTRLPGGIPVEIPMPRVELPKRQPKREAGRRREEDYAGRGGGRAAVDGRKGSLPRDLADANSALPAAGQDALPEQAGRTGPRLPAAPGRSAFGAGEHGRCRDRAAGDAAAHGHGCRACGGGPSSSTKASAKTPGDGGPWARPARWPSRRRPAGTRPPRKQLRRRKRARAMPWAI